MTHILIVDDDETILPMLKLLLERMNFSVSFATNGLDALRLAKQTKFDLVITDIVMPDVEGLELIMTLRKSDPTCKIIAMSGGSPTISTRYLEMALKLGASHTIEKPFTPEKLGETVRAALAM